MYIIWNHRIWNVGDTNNGAGGWKPYVGASEHTDHIHFSFTWAGAMGVTSWWTGKVSVNDFGPCRVYLNNPAPRWSVANPKPCASPTTGPSSTQPLAWMGTVSAAVGHAQALLGLPVDDTFGQSTQNAVYKFQLAHGLPLTAALDADTWVTLDPTTLVGGGPLGHLDAATPVGSAGALEVRGWVFDRQSTSSTSTVTITVDGQPFTTPANVSRPDVDAVYHTGTNHGFDTTLAVGYGLHTVCASSKGVVVPVAGEPRVHHRAGSAARRAHRRAGPSLTSGLVRTGGLAPRRPGQLPRRARRSRRYSRSRALSARSAALR